MASLFPTWRDFQVCRIYYRSLTCDSSLCANIAFTYTSSISLLNLHSTNNELKRINNNFIAYLIHNGNLSNVYFNNNESRNQKLCNNYRYNEAYLLSSLCVNKWLLNNVNWKWWIVTKEFYKQIWVVSRRIKGRENC